MNNNLEERGEILKATSEELRATTEELYITNDSLKETNATKDKFFSIIAHDLKNPFHAITGISSLLKKSYSVLNDDKKQEFISMIEQSSKSAANLLENLLTWSRAKTNTIKYNPKFFDINEIVNKTINLLNVNAQKKTFYYLQKLS